MGGPQRHTKKSHRQRPNPTTQDLCQNMNIINHSHRNQLSLQDINLQTCHSLKTKKKHPHMKNLIYIRITKKNSFVLLKQRIGTSVQSQILLEQCALNLEIHQFDFIVTLLITQTKVYSSSQNILHGISFINTNFRNQN